MDQRLTDLMSQLATALGMKAIALEPTALLAAAEKALTETLRSTLKEVLSDANEPMTDALVEKLYEELPDEDIITAVAGSLATSLLTHFKENSDDLITAIIEELDLTNDESFMDLVAEKVASRITLS